MAALMNRILAATDLSIAGQSAVVRASQLARQWQASLRIVHARPDWNLYARWRPASQDAYQLIARRTDQLLGELQANVTAEFGISPRVDSRLGRASEVVAEMVSEFDPSLLVIGARGEHAHDDGSNIGGTAWKLLTRFGHAILLVRATGASPYAKSVVAVDGPTPLARRAVLWGTSLVGSGETHIVHAYCIPYIERMRSPDESGAPGAASSSDHPSEHQLTQAADAAAATLAEVRGAAESAAQVETHAVHAGPVVATVQQIAKHAAAVAVIGRRNVQTPLVPSGAIGNVAFRIADQAPADVLILS